MPDATEAAAQQPAQEPEKRQMPAFLAKMMQANQNIICTARAEDVGKVCIADLLRRNLRIPIFQRRYAWSKEQWRTLLGDAGLVAGGYKEMHSLGRITCVSDASQGDVLIVVDGQQRNTTAVLLLAAIRDIASERNSEEHCLALAESIDAVLFADTQTLENWIADRTRSSPGSYSIGEGEALDFAALVPTYCDRASFFAAILPARAGTSSDACEWQRPMECKLYFLEQLRERETDFLLTLADAVLHKLQWLLFPINLSGDHGDGTEDLQVIYERLALRDATVCKPSRSTEYANMGAADFVRNLVLGSFSSESDAISVYKDDWLPIEKAAAAAAKTSRQGDIAKILESMLTRFLDVQSEAMQVSFSAPVQGFSVGGNLYARFRRWFEAAMAGQEAQQADELKTTNLVRTLKVFALDFYKNPPSKLATPSTSFSTLLLESKRAPRKWRCTFCKMCNETTSTVCTACMKPNLACLPTR
eukprot:TRINITY_DN26088_c0_g1_i1.p1 TRINITY_DN26088_c0_g1~~TRINITY_DN26088_c0_g1_i1.p1  ORF type:complete len:475 (-),score=97.00 TRINITY_DN26088_c0_g1_i1:222-1646(-)